MFPPALCAAICGWDLDPDQGAWAWRAQNSRAAQDAHHAVRRPSGIGAQPPASTCAGDLPDRLQPCVGDIRPIAALGGRITDAPSGNLDEAGIALPDLNRHGSCPAPLDDVHRACAWFLPADLARLLAARADLRPVMHPSPNSRTRCAMSFLMAALWVISAVVIPSSACRS